jgi:hypothetical protein
MSEKREERHVSPRDLEEGSRARKVRAWEREEQNKPPSLHANDDVIRISDLRKQLQKSKRTAT